MIAVFGSANIDLVLEAERIPRPGETVAARRLFSRYPGGKGANQAIAAARLGAEVSFFGKVGDDGYGSDLLRTLSDDGIDVASVVRAEFHSGIALITVSPEGENAIVYLAGANGSIDRSYVDSVIDRLASAEILLLQLEVPLPAIAYLLESLPEGRPLVILDPAPARDISSRRGRFTRRSAGPSSPDPSLR